MKTFKIYSLIVIFFFPLSSVFNTAHADCNISDKSALMGKDLAGCNLRRADLEGANLRGAVLRDANLEGANLEFAHLKSATWVDGRTCAKKSRGECL